MSAAVTSWGLLRPGLLADLQLPSAAAFAARFGVGVDHARAALAREVAPSDELVAALLRFYLVLPTLYFLEPPVSGSMCSGSGDNWVVTSGLRVG